MSKITEYLQQILSARYGKDVRQSIHDSIKELDGIATTAQDSATANAQTAISKASEALTASQEATQKAQEALESAEQAKVYAERAEAATGIKKATQETTSTTLPDSNSGRLKINELKGVMEQGENPSHTNQQEIRNVSISGITTHRKNFAYSNRASDLVTQGITYHIVRDSLGRILYIEVSGTSTADAVFNLSKKQLTVGKEYVVSGCPSGGNKDTYCMNWAYAGDDVGEGFSHVYNGTEGQLRIRIKNGVTVNNLRFYPMLREVGTDATYEPYTESSITFSQPIDIYGLEDVQDILTSKQIGRKYVKRIWNGSEDWKTSSSLFGRYYLDNIGCPHYGKVLCSQAKGLQAQTTTVNECWIAASNQPKGRFLINTEFATLDEWKAHLQTNPMTVVHEMAEETTEELPIVDQIALNSLQTFDGITHVEFVSDVQPTYKAEYGTSKEGGYILESLLTARNNDLRISAMEA